MLTKTPYQLTIWLFLCAVLSACGGGSDSEIPVQADGGTPLPESLELPAPPDGSPEEGGAVAPVANPAPVADPVPVTQSPPIDDVAGSPEASSPLVGTWRTGCIAAPEAESAPGRFILSASFNGARSETSSAQFSDENCTQLFVEFVTVGTWTNSATVLTPSGFQAIQLDTRVQSIAVTYHDLQTVSTLNMAGYCGVVLEVGISVDVTQCLIDLGFSERDRFSLVMVVDGVLYPGDASTGNGNSPENRPTDVDFTQAHLFVQP